MHSVVASRHQVLNGVLINPAVEYCGCVTISAEEYIASKEVVSFNPRAKFSDDFLQDVVNPMLFFVIRRQIAPSQFTPVFKSEVKSYSKDQKDCGWNAGLEN